MASAGRRRGGLFGAEYRARLERELADVGRRLAPVGDFVIRHVAPAVAPGLRAGMMAAEQAERLASNARARPQNPQPRSPAVRPQVGASARPARKPAPEAPGWYTAANVGLRAANPITRVVLPMDAGTDAFEEGARSGILLGGKNEIASAVYALPSLLSDGWSSFGEEFDAQLARRDAYDAALRSRHPIAWYGGAGAGAVAGTVVAPWTRAGVPVRIAGDALAGGAAGFLGADGSLTERSAGAVFGTAAGGAFSTVARPAGQRLDWLLEPYLPAKVAKPVGPSGRQYSVAYETTLPPSSYPVRSRELHNREAADALLREMEADAEFASMMGNLKVSLRRSSTGLAPRRSPRGWSWHHDQAPGTMQLVPREQHEWGSLFQGALHPNGKGGWSIWGSE